MSNNLNLTVNFSAIDKLTRPYKSLIKTNANYSKGVIKTASQLNKLKKSQAQLAKYQGLEKRLSQSANKVDKLKSELRKLGSEIKSSDTPTKKLTASYARKQRQLNTLITKTKKYKEDLNNAAGSMRKMGVFLKN